VKGKSGGRLALFAPAWLVLGLESPEPSQHLWKQESKVLSTAPGQALYQVYTALKSGTRAQKDCWVFCLAVVCQEAVHSPPSNYLKDQIKLPPG